jgi:hypothetical protein
VSMRFPSGPARLCALFPALLAFASVLASGRAEARTAYGLNFADQIITFDTFAPGSPSAIVAISGLQAGETPLAIDLRPSTGQIYLLVTGSRLYVVNPVTGAATAVGAAFTPALSGSSFGFDFEPTFDTLRVVSDTGQNLRLNPDTGAVVAVDPVLTPGAAHIVGSAYSNNYAGATSTTLYAIDSTTDQVFVQDAFTGVLTLVGPIGVNTSDAVGFDISAHDGTGFATLTVAGTTRLYLVGLTGGPASDIGAVANGPYRDLTILARGVPMVALRGNELIRFHSATPGTIRGSATISGLQFAEQLVGIDVRPANGRLYGVGSTSRLYQIDPISGVATQIGSPFTTPLSGTRFGVDFNPTTDRLRIVSDAEQNLRINPNNGAVAGNDPALTPAGSVVGAAFTNNVDGATTTLFYGIDQTTTSLVRHHGGANPNDGGLVVVGPLNLFLSAGLQLGFDISPLDNFGFVAIPIQGTSSLCWIDLFNARSQFIGQIGTGAAIDGLAAMPLGYQFAEGSTGTFFDTDLLIANPTVDTVPVTISLLTETGRVVTRSVFVLPQSRVTIQADQLAALGAAAFSSTVTSHLGIPLAVERTMRWDATGYGMHTEKAMPSLSRTWFFAEGAQGFYDTFFLLTNPSPAPNTATLRFFLENGAQVTRTVNLTPQSRLTVYAGAIPELVNQSFGTEVTFAFAGATERAMYFGSPLFSGGHESAGVTSTSREWFLAEGATGSFFTTFVLLSNPNPTPANVLLYYYREGGGFIPDSLTMPAGSRRTINIAASVPILAATSVATRVTSDVGIVVERSMYWPMTPASWNEASNAFGVTQTSQRWALAEGRVGGPFAFQTYILLANPDTTADAIVAPTFLRASGAPVPKSFTVPAGGRLTITTGPGSMVPELANESFGMVLAASRPVFVERAMYSNANGVFWAAGSAATATPMPFP